MRLVIAEREGFIKWLIKRSGLPRDEEDDVVQEWRARIFEEIELGGLEAEDNSQRSLEIAKAVVRGAKRKSEKERALVGGDAVAQLTGPDCNEGHPELIELIERLPDGYDKALLINAFGYSPEEAASILGCTKDAYEKRRRVAREHIGKYLEHKLRGKPCFGLDVIELFVASPKKLKRPVFYKVKRHLKVCEHCRAQVADMARVELGLVLAFPTFGLTGPAADTGGLITSLLDRIYATWQDSRDAVSSLFSRPELPQATAHTAEAHLSGVRPGVAVGAVAALVAFGAGTYKVGDKLISGPDPATTNSAVGAPSLSDSGIESPLPEVSSDVGDSYEATGGPQEEEPQKKDEAQDANDGNQQSQQDTDAGAEGFEAVGDPTASGSEGLGEGPNDASREFTPSSQALGK